MPEHSSRQEGNRWRLALTLFVTKGGDETMTAYEIIVIVIAIITLAFSIHNGNHKD